MITKKNGENLTVNQNFNFESLLGTEKFEIVLIYYLTNKVVSGVNRLSSTNA